jgi:hypothetical protein
VAGWLTPLRFCAVATAVAVLVYSALSRALVWVAVGTQSPFCCGVGRRVVHSAWEDLRLTGGNWGALCGELCHQVALLVNEP